MGLNGAKYSDNLPEWFAQHPGHFWDGYFLATLLYYWNISQIWQNNVFDEIVHAIKWFSKAPWAKWPEEAWEHFMLLVENSVCYRKNASNLHLRGGSPYFSIYCLINSFSHEQLLRQSVLIFFIYASFPNHCPPLSTTSHHYPPLYPPLSTTIHHYPPLTTTIPPLFPPLTSTIHHYPPLYDHYTPLSTSQQIQNKSPVEVT